MITYKCIKPKYLKLLDISYMIRAENFKSHFADITKEVSTAQKLRKVSINKEKLNGS